MVGPCVRMYRCALDDISVVLVVAIARVDLVRRSIISLFFLFVVHFVIIVRWTRGVRRAIVILFL